MIVVTTGAEKIECSQKRLMNYYTTLPFPSLVSAYVP